MLLNTRYMDYLKMKLQPTEICFLVLNQSNHLILTTVCHSMLLCPGLDPVRSVVDSCVESPLIPLYIPKNVWNDHVALNEYMYICYLKRGLYNRKETSIEHLDWFQRLLTEITGCTSMRMERPGTSLVNIMCTLV
jgi:hypothetical protein